MNFHFIFFLFFLKLQTLNLFKNNSPILFVNIFFLFTVRSYYIDYGIINYIPPLVYIYIRQLCHNLEERKTVSRYKILQENIFYLLSALNVAKYERRVRKKKNTFDNIVIELVTSLAFSQLVNRKIRAKFTKQFNGLQLCQLLQSCIQKMIIELQRKFALGILFHKLVMIYFL